MNDLHERQENTALLELRDISHRYSQGTIDLDVLMGASLTVLAGEMKALVGPSGSGGARPDAEGRAGGLSANEAEGIPFFVAQCGKAACSLALPHAPSVLQE